MGNHTGTPGTDTCPGVIKITKAGWFYILLTIFLGVSGINTGNNLIYLIVAAFLSFMSLSGVFGKSNLSKIDVRIELPEEIYADTSSPVKVVLRNKRRFLPAFLIRVHVSGNDILFPFVEVKGETSRYLALSFRERGRLQIGNTYLSSVFPFHFFTRYRMIPGTFNAIVFPKAKKCPSPDSLNQEKKSQGEQTANRTGFEAEIISLRDYMQGDPLKYIHWKASAKTGRLKTKEMSSLSHKLVIIDFDTLPVQDLEEKISCATYLLLNSLKRNVPVGLKIDGTLYRPSPGTLQERTKTLRCTILTRLALYGKG